MNQVHAPEEKAEIRLIKELIRVEKHTANRQLVMIIVVGLLTIVLAVSSILVIPRTIKTINNINAIVEEADKSLDDIDEMVRSVDTLVDNNMEGITEALTKLNEIDIDSINSSLENMSTVLDSLSKIANLFK